MLREIKNLAKLNLLNLYGLNVIKYSNNPKDKKRLILLLCAYVLVALIALGYVGGLCTGLVMLGAADIIPAYLIMISSMIILMFGIFKAGPMLFNQKGLDILAAMPVSEKSIVISRFIRFYVENLILSVPVMVVGMAVYGWFIKPAPDFYLIGLAVSLFIPLIPLVVASVLGSIFSYVTSKVKHKSIVSTVLTIAVVAGTFVLPNLFLGKEDLLTEDILRNYADLVMGIIADIYPPAVWMGNAMMGEGLLLFVGFALISSAAFALFVLIISAKFTEITSGLSQTYATHDYSVSAQNQSSLLMALYKKELKRYFASSIYVTNTIVGPALGVILAAATIFTDEEAIFSTLPIEVDVKAVIPFILSMVFCLMTTTCTSISMEGKEWWIVKSLPVSTKRILDAKIIFNLSLYMPFVVVAVVLMMIGLRPTVTEAVLFIAIPVLMLVFACVWGIFINLKMPQFNWESDVQVVKQSASAAIGGLGSAAIVLLLAVVVFLVPADLKSVVSFIICGAVGAVTAILYSKNNKIDLREI